MGHVTTIHWTKAIKDGILLWRITERGRVTKGDRLVDPAKIAGANKVALIGQRGTSGTWLHPSPELRTPARRAKWKWLPPKRFPRMQGSWHPWKVRDSSKNKAGWDGWMEPCPFGANTIILSPTKIHSCMSSVWFGGSDSDCRCYEKSI